MNEEQILQQLQPIFRDVFDNPGLEIGPGDSGATVEGWDSLTHINLVTNIERAFKIRFALGELQELKNVGEMVSLMAVKLSKS